MTFLPIVARELRTRARRSSTIWARWIVALLVFAVWVAVAISSRHSSPSQLAKDLFLATGILAFCFCLLAGFFLTADCLSEEKRDGTIGLLFLTDLNGYDVVLGKLFATSLHAFYGLLAVLPVLSLPLMMGGITGGEFWRVVLVLLITLLLSLGIGMLSSALNREARESMAAALLGMVLIVGIPPAIWWIQAVLGKGLRFPSIVLLSPAQTFRAALHSSYGSRVGLHEFWLSLAWVTAFACLSLLAAAVLVQRNWRRSTDPAPSTKPLSPAQHRKRSRLLDENPFFWAANRTRLIGRIPLLLTAVVASVWAIFLALAVIGPRHKEAFIVSLFAAYATHQIVKWIVVAEVTRQLNVDYHSGALELLLVTPVREQEILRGYSKAFRRRIGPLARLLMVVNVCMCLLTFLSPKHLSMDAKDQAIFVELFLGGLVVLFFDLHAFRTIGMCMALRCRRNALAILATLGRVQFPGWAMIFLIVFGGQGRALRPGGIALTFALWFLFGIITDAVFSAIAAMRLRRGFRHCLNLEPEQLRPPSAPPIAALKPLNA